MNKINFHNKRFQLVNNSPDGEVTDDVVFDYQQEGNVVTAKYHGGTVIEGNIIGHLNGAQLDMRYHCITLDKELKAGKAVANISFDRDGRMRLSLDWEWMNGAGNGKSEYVEI